ncbi:MAG: DUF1801 domain-containing protein, partial [Myxococcales bacterium]
MVSSKATTVKAYLASLPADRRADIEAVREVILKNLPPGYEEGMQYGMISYHVPLARYPHTYNGQPLGIAALASQKQYMSVYLMGAYADPEHERRFTAAWARSGKKLDMGKSCVRFKHAGDLALDVIGELLRSIGVDEFIAMYERSRSPASGAKKRDADAASPAAGRQPARTAATKRAKNRS